MRSNRRPTAARSNRLFTLGFDDVFGPGGSCTGALEVDGKTVDTDPMPKAIPMLPQWDERLDIGSETPTCLHDVDDIAPIHFTGELGEATRKIDGSKRSPEDVEKRETSMRSNEASESRGPFEPQIRRKS